MSLKDKVYEKGMEKAKWSWQRILLFSMKSFSDNQVNLHASSLTYYIIFAIFPCLIFLSSLLAFLNLPETAVNDALGTLLPESILELINTTLSHMHATYTNNWLTFGLLFSAWFAWRAIRNTLFSVAYMYHTKMHEKKFMQTFLLMLLLIVSVPLSVLILLVGQEFLEFINMFVPMADNFIAFWPLIRLGPLTVGIFIVFVLIYMIAVGKRTKKRYLLPGAILSTVVWLMFSLCFVYYVDHMANYSVIYGSIGTMIALLVWLQVSVVVCLMGAVFNHSLKQELEPENISIDMPV